MDYELGIMDVLAKSAMYQKGKVITLKKIAPEKTGRNKELPIKNIVSYYDEKLLHVGQLNIFSGSC